MRTLAASGVRTTSGSSVVSSAFTPVAGTILEVAVAIRAGAAIQVDSMVETPSSGTWGFTWVIRQAAQTTGSTRVRIAIAYALVPAGTYASGTLAAALSNTTSNAIIRVWSNDTPPDSGAPEVQWKAAQSTTDPITMELNAAPDAANDVFAVACSYSSSNDLQPGDSGGLSELDEASSGAATNLELIVLTRTGSTDATVDAKNVGTTNNMLIAVEFLAAPPAGDPPDGSPIADLSATADSATVVTLTWTEESTNHTHNRIEQAPDVAGSPGTWAAVETVSAVETYEVDGLSEKTKYHWRVFEVNADGESSASNVDFATTLALPTVDRVSPASVSFTLPALDVGLPFEVLAFDEDDDPTPPTIEWEVNGIPFGTGLDTEDINLLTDLDDGLNVITVLVTDSDGDTATTGWNVTIAEIGSSGLSQEDKLIRSLPVPYGTLLVERSVVFLDPSGQPTAPTFVTGDIRYRLDDGTFENFDVDDVVQVGAELAFDITVPAVLLEGGHLKLFVKDLTDPAAFRYRELEWFTTGHENAYYPEPLQVLGADDKALLSDDNVGADITAGPPGVDASLMEMVSAIYAKLFHKKDNDGDLEQLYNEAGDTVVAEAAITNASGVVTKAADVAP